LPQQRNPYTKFLRVWLLAVQRGGDLIRHGERLRFAMAVLLRTDFDALQVRAAAKATKDGPQVRRLLALAAICDGGTRGEAAPRSLLRKLAGIGGATLQIVRDWVMRFNAHGPAGLVDHKSTGRPTRLNDAHRCHAAAKADIGPVHVDCCA